MNRGHKHLQRIARFLPFVIVAVFSAWILWPVPLGTMPLSADHPVHLQRALLWQEILAGGHVRGWSFAWFFGTPIGELYPVLGDACVLVVRTLSFGLASPSTAYAWTFWWVFAFQGWALLIASRRLGLGDVAGTCAALLLLADVGSYREGGWIYTVYYGVWPQALATALSWLGFAELSAALLDADPVRARKRTGWAALAFAAALLAHPASLLVIAVGSVVAIVAIGRRPKAMAKLTVRIGFVVAAALAIAAWWLVPMIVARGWMASYGWLGPSLEHALTRLIQRGAWCQGMPSPIGILIAVAIAGIALAGSRPARFVAAVTLALWLLSTADIVWWLRLDLLSDGFRHLQYQRFILAAKPGLFLLAGVPLAVLCRIGVMWLRRGPMSRIGGFFCLGIAVGATLWLGFAQRAAWRAHPVPALQTVRWPEHPNLDDDYQALSRWLSARWDERDRFFRSTLGDLRNVHWFVDLTHASGGMPLFKQGFTPGDNFVHKPEKGTSAVLDAAMVRYDIRRSRRTPSPATVAIFGEIQVRERSHWRDRSVAWLEGPGSVEIITFEPRQAKVRVHVHGSRPSSRLVFGIAGHPRWTLTGPHGPVAWVEHPITGQRQDATPTQRRTGALRGGKAGGQDGSEPILIAAPTADGVYTLHFEARRATDIVSGVVSLVVFIVVLALIGGHRFRLGLHIDNAITRLQDRMRPLWLWVALVGVALAGLGHVLRGHRVERDQAMGWVGDGTATDITAIEPGLLKTDMLIRPALLVRPHPSRPASATFHGVLLPDPLEGYYALDDDAAMSQAHGHHRIRIDIRLGDGTWDTRFDRRIAHRPGQVPFSIETNLRPRQRADVRVRIDAGGRSPPRLGFDLALPRTNEPP